MFLDNGEEAKLLKDKFFIQLNLNTKDKSLNFGEDIIVLKFLEYYRNLYYTDSTKLDESGFWLAGLNSTTFSELFDIYSNILNNNDLTKLIEEVYNMSMENFNIHEWNKEKMDELVMYNHYKDGKEEGIKETINITVKEMLKNNADI